MNDIEKEALRLKKEEEQQIIKEHWQEKLIKFFEKIAILQQTPEQKQEIALTVKDELEAGRLYWIQIILSSLIATFGLLQNSVAVIIGAMLIAPLLRPIQGIAYGIAEGSSRIILRGSKLLILSSLLSILLAYIVVLVLSVQTSTPEILARTAPNLFDLFIAVASAIIAILSLSYKKLSDSVAGVAMAAALMPPLSVIGIEIALGSFANAWGSFLLFFTNIIAILFVGAIVFIFYGFTPHKERSDKTAKNIAILSLVIAILSIPLVSSLTNISQKIDLEARSKTIISEILLQKIPAATLNNIELNGVASKKTINLSGEIRLPENIEFFAEIIDETTRELSQRLEKDIQLDLDIIRTASIISKNQKSPLQVQINTALKDIFVTNIRDGILVNTEVTELPDTEKTWSIKALYTIEAGKILDDIEKGILQEYLNKRFPELTLKHLWVQLAERRNPSIGIDVIQSERDEQQSQYSAKIEQFLQENIKQGSFDNLKVQIDADRNKLQATVDISVPVELLDAFIADFDPKVETLETTLSFEATNISYKIFPYYQRANDLVAEELVVEEE